MKQAQADIQYVASVKAFDKGNFAEFLEAFFKAIHSRYDIEKPLIQRFIRRKLGIINRLKEENRLLKNKCTTTAAEFTEVRPGILPDGNECITKARPEGGTRPTMTRPLELYPEYVDAWVRKE